MNETLQEHLETKNPSTGTAREMLHIESMETSNGDLNYAGNTYLVALYEIARLRELLKKVEFFYSDVTTARFSRGADHDLLEEVRAELGPLSVCWCVMMGCPIIQQ